MKHSKNKYPLQEKGEIKTKDELAKMRIAGQISALAMREVEKALKPRVTTEQLDKIVEDVFKKSGAEPSFKTVGSYQYSICATPNDWVVHGLPGNYELKAGDIVGIDLGALYRGYHSDMAQTFAVGKVNPKVKDFLETGERALWRAIKTATAGSRVGDISNVIQTEVERKGFSVVKELVGHGIGRSLHEEPLIPGRGYKGTGPHLHEGMTIAIEIIYNFGKPQIVLLEDGWTIASRDGSLAGLFERTVEITSEGPVVLTA